MDDPKIGYLLPTREQIMRGDSSVGRLIDLAYEAQSLGYDSVWVGDSLLARPRHDPITVLAAVAAVVPQIQVGTAVLLPALRNPVVLAQQLATLDQISQGRLIVGAGIAADTPASRAEFAAAGVPFARRVGRLVEGLQLCRALWSGDSVDWDGRWPVVQSRLAPVPYQSHGPPIWLASSVPAGIRRAARLFDGWFPIGPDVAGFAANKEIFSSVAREKTTDSTTAIYLTIALGANAVDAQARIDDYLNAYYGLPAEILRKVQACCGGTLEEVVAFIRSYVEAGAQHVVLRIVGDHSSTLSELASMRGELVA